MAGAELGAGWVSCWWDDAGGGYLGPDVKVTALAHLNLSTCITRNYILRAILDQMAQIVHTIVPIGTFRLPSAFGLIQFLIFPAL